MIWEYTERAEMKREYIMLFQHYYCHVGTIPVSGRWLSNKSFVTPMPATNDISSIHNCHATLVLMV